jgi:hypothetical protein
MEIKLKKLIKTFRNHNHRLYKVYETNYGLIKVDDVQFKKGHKLTIQSALNIAEFFNNIILEKYKGVDIKILTPYTNNKEKILIKLNGIKYSVFSKNLLKNLPNTNSCLELNKLFKYKAKKIHGDKYNYDKSDYISNNKELVITCKTHGDFKQLPASHLKGSGCKLCGLQKAASSRITFTGGINNAIVYCLKIKDENNKIFYKIGITKHSVEYRYRKRKNTIKMPYTYKIMFEKTLKYKTALKYEKVLHRYLGKYHYKPLKSFDGSATECYNNKIEKCQIIKQLFLRETQKVK